MVGLSQIGTLDPPRASGSSALTILRTACDGLVGLDPESGEPKPALAEGWTLEEGARKLTLALRPEMTFQDGTPVTGAAVREALSRVARPSTSSPWSSLISKVEGFAEVQAGTATHLSGVRPVDERSLEIRLSEPYSDFPTVLAHPALLPVSLESLTDELEGPETPVCAGPYQVEAGLEEGDLRLVRSTDSVSRNQAYLDNGSGLAERILVRAFQSPEDAYQAYKDGQVDMAPVPDSRLAEAQVSGAGYTSGATPQITFLAFDPANPATADPRFRHAVSLAIDRLVIIDAAYGDQRRPATRWLPGDYGPGVESACEGVARRIADPERATQLLRASGVNAGSFELPLIYDPATTGRLVAEALQLQVTEVLGLTLEPQALEGEDIVASFKSREGAPAVWIMSTSIDLPLPDQFLADLFRTGSDKNVLGFSDPTFDARIDSARTATDQDEIERFYVQAENALCNQMPAIPLWTSVSHWMINPDGVEFEGEQTLDSLGEPVLRHALAAGE
ncbi:MAG TPA: ABC transporter substrate-binding protein [Actinomycetota bacterium]|nr:ABC transporter substrate-binding protein [Actinomycetota bacterium]